MHLYPLEYSNLCLTKRRTFLACVPHFFRTFFATFDHSQRKRTQLQAERFYKLRENEGEVPNAVVFICRSFVRIKRLIILLPTSFRYPLTNGTPAEETLFGSPRVFNSKKSRRVSDMLRVHFKYASFIGRVPFSLHYRYACCILTKVELFESAKI